MKRRDGESYEDYRTRRKGEQKALKVYLKGRLYWDSSKRGTYKIVKNPCWKGEVVE